MKHQDIPNRLAPCGLSCRKCFACTEGDIAGHSRELKRLLGNFAPHLKARRIQMNRRIREVGVEAYFEETRNAGRYR